MAATFFNHNQILGVQLISATALKWKVGNALFPFDQAFHLQSIAQKRRITLAYLDNGTYKSLSDDTTVTSFDAFVNLTPEPTPLIIDGDDISFKSSADKQRSGLLYSNTLEYSLPKVTATEYTQQEKQINLLRSGQAFHLLLNLYSCERAYAIVLCPSQNAFSATVDESLSNTKVSIGIKNLSAVHFLN